MIVLTNYVLLSLRVDVVLLSWCWTTTTTTAAYRITGLMPRARLTCARPTRCVHCYVYESSEV